MSSSTSSLPVCGPSTPHQCSIPSRGSLTVRINQSRSRAPFHLRALARPLVPVSVTASRNACYTISYTIGPRGPLTMHVNPSFNSPCHFLPIAEVLSNPDPSPVTPSPVTHTPSSPSSL